MKVPMIGVSILRLSFIILLCIIYVVLHTVSMQPLVQCSIYALVLKGVVEALVGVALSFVLCRVFMYGNFVALPPYLRIINHTALGLLWLVIWTWSGYLVLYLSFGDEVLEQFSGTKGMTAFIGILVYSSVASFLHREIDRRKATALSIMQVQEKEEPEIIDIAGESEEAEKEDVKPEVLERVTVKTGQKIQVVNVSEINFIQSDGDYVQINTDSGKFLKEETMKYFEQHLPQQHFVRVHRSYIVNIEAILRIELFEKQSQLLLLRDGSRIRTSAAGYKALRAALNL